MMNFPRSNDFIDIHNHGAKPRKGFFSIENLMAHEERTPDNETGLTYSYGIHPWFLTEENNEKLIKSVRDHAGHDNLIAIGEAGFDKLKGPSLDIQCKTFEEQILIANRYSKPVFIHCVRSWDELMAEYKKLKPKTPWLIHGFRGKNELALQLISKGMYLSFWIDFVLRPDSAKLLRGVPEDRFFLETDGTDTDIASVYGKVAVDLNISVHELKKIMYSNFRKFFNF
jgi:TatD DNase family protein